MIVFDYLRSKTKSGKLWPWIPTVLYILSVMYGSIVIYGLPLIEENLLAISDYTGQLIEIIFFIILFPLYFFAWVIMIMSSLLLIFPPFRFLPFDLIFDHCDIFCGLTFVGWLLGSLIWFFPVVACNYFLIWLSPGPRRKSFAVTAAILDANKKQQ